MEEKPLEYRISLLDEYPEDRKDSRIAALAVENLLENNFIYHLANQGVFTDKEKTRLSVRYSSRGCAESVSPCEIPVYEVVVPLETKFSPHFKTLVVGASLVLSEIEVSLRNYHLVDARMRSGRDSPFEVFPDKYGIVGYARVPASGNAEKTAEYIAAIEKILMEYYASIVGKPAEQAFTVV